MLGANKGAAGSAPNKNLSVGSSDLTNAVNWPPAFMTVLGGQPDPFGGSNAFRLTDDITNNPHTFSTGAGIPVTTGVTYVFSHYAKAGTLGFCQLLLSSASMGTCYANFDLNLGTMPTLTAGTSTNATGGIINIGSGWYRVYLSAQALASTTTFLPAPRMADSGVAVRTAGYPGAGSTIFAYGPQFELGAVPTSYSPT